MAAGPAAGQATIEWRRLAADKHVSIDLASKLWEQAKAAATDPVKRSDLFRKLIDEAAKNPTAAPEPGKQTLVDAPPTDPAAAAAAGPGKTTQVLLDKDQKPGAAKPAENAAPTPAIAGADPAAAAGPDAKPKGEEPTAKPTVDKVRADLSSAAQAAKDVAAMLAEADPATIMEALRQIRDGEPNLLHKILTVAGGAIEARIGKKFPDPTQTQTDGPVGVKVPYETGDGTHTHSISDAGVPMAGTVSIASKVAEWMAEIEKRDAAAKETLTPAVGRVTALDATATDQAKKAKLGEEVAKTALEGTQKKLAAELGNTSRQIAQKPVPPPAADPAKQAAPADAKSVEPQADASSSAVAPSPKDAAVPISQAKGPNGKDPNAPAALDKQPAVAGPEQPQLEPAEQQLEDFVKDEVSLLKPKQFASATKATVLALVNDLGAFELGLQLKIGKYATNVKAIEAKAFLSDSRSALEDAAQKAFTLTVLGKTAAPKPDPASYKELDTLKAEITPWVTAFKKDPAFVRGVAACNDMTGEIDKALASILAHRDKLLSAAKTAIDAVDVNIPGTAIADEIAKVQVWLDAITLPDPGSLRASVVVAKQLKEENIKKAADAKAAEAKKAAEAQKPADAQANEPAKTDPQQAQPQQKAAAQPAAPQPEAAKELTPQERAELERAKEELELHKVEEQLELAMENALKGWEVFNLGGSGALTAAVLIAHIAPQVAIPLAVGKAGIMFFTKYSKKKGYKQAKNQLQMLSPEQIRELGDIFDSDLLSFKQAIELVDKQAKVAKFQAGAGAATMKTEAAPLAVDAVEVGTGAADIAGLHSHVLHLAHVGASIAGPIVAGIQLGQTFHGASHVADKIKKIKAKIAEIDKALGRPVAPEAPLPPPPPAEAFVIPPLPPAPKSAPPPAPPPLPAIAGKPATPPPAAADPAKDTKEPPKEEPLATAAEPIVVPTSMAGAPHTLKADPTAGKIEFNSIAGFAAEKLKSIYNLIPEDKRQKLQAAIASAVEAAAIVVDPALKPGATPNDRPAVVKRLGAALHDLAGSIRSFGDSTKYTDADPETVKRIDAEQKKAQDTAAAAGLPAAVASGAPPTPNAATLTAAPPQAALNSVAATPPTDSAAPTAPGTPEAAKADAAPKPDAANADAAKPEGAKPDAAGAPSKDAAAPTAAAANSATEAAPPAPAAAKDAGAASTSASKDAAAPDKDPSAPATSAPDAAKAAAGAKPPLDYDSYINHVVTSFGARISALTTVKDEQTAKDLEQKRLEAKFTVTAEAIVKLKTELATLQAAALQGPVTQEAADEAKKLQNKIKAAKELNGMTMPQLLERAKALVAEIKQVGDEAKKEKAELERVLQSSVVLAKVIDKEGFEKGRKLYKEIDEGENQALVAKGRETGMPESELAAMAVNHRNWLRKYWRLDVMQDKNNAEIMFLRDEGKEGSRDGMTVQQVMDKQINTLPVDDATKQRLRKGDFDFPEAKELMDKVYALMIDSASKTNAGVNETAGIPAKPAAAANSNEPVPAVAAAPAPNAAPEPVTSTVAPAVTPVASPAPTGEGAASAPPAKADAPTAPPAKADASLAADAPVNAPTAKADAPAADAAVNADAAPAKAEAPPALPAAKTESTPAEPAKTDAPAKDASVAAPTAPTAPVVATSEAPTVAPPVAAGNTPSATASPIVAAPDAKPEAPAHTPEQSRMELASITNATIPQGKGEPAAKIALHDPPIMVIRSDSPDPIRLKDQLITLTKKYLELDKEQKPDTPKQREKLLEEIKAKFAELREAMAYARGEDSQLTNVRVRFEKFIGVKAMSNAWTQGHEGLDRMATQAKLILLQSKNVAELDAKTVDAKLRELARTDPKWGAAIGAKLGTDINIGFAGAVGKAFTDVLDALTTGSMVQKAQTLINFSEQFLTKELLGGPSSAALMTRIRKNIEDTQKEAAAEAAKQGTAAPTDFKLDQRLENAKKVKPVKGLMSSPEFMEKMEGADLTGKTSGLKVENKHVDADRQEAGGELLNKSKISSDNTHLAGEMDSKAPQVPVEVLDETQLDFLASQGKPQVSFKECEKESDPEKRRLAKVAALKAAGIHLSKAPGMVPDPQGGGVWPPYGQGVPKDEKGKDAEPIGAGMVDATSIVPTAAVPVADQITVKDEKTGKDQTYIEGKAENIVDPMHSWIKKAREAHAPLKAGISGTTARFAGAAQMLGATKHQAVVAMIGHLQAIEAHSFYEIVDGAGLGMAPGKYVPFAPNPGGMEAAGAEFVKEHVHNIGPDDADKKKKVILGQE